MKLELVVLLAALGAGLIGDASAGSGFEPGTRMTMGPTLARDAPAAAAPTTPEPAPMVTPLPTPSAAEQATAVARSVVRKVDPTMRSLIIRRH